MWIDISAVEEKKFTMLSLDGSGSGGRSTAIRGFSVSKHRIKLLPYSSMTIFKHNHVLLNGILLEIIFIKQYLQKYFKQHLN